MFNKLPYQKTSITSIILISFGFISQSFSTPITCHTIISCKALILLDEEVLPIKNELLSPKDIKNLKKLSLNGEYLHQLGVNLLQQSSETEKDILAKAILKKAAKLNYADSQYLLGVLNYAGIGSTKRNYKIALQRFKESAENDHTDGQLFLGKMYLKGQGTKIDIAKATIWLTKAAQNGSREARLLLRS